MRLISSLALLTLTVAACTLESSSPSPAPIPAAPIAAPAAGANPAADPAAAAPAPGPAGAAPTATPAGTVPASSATLSASFLQAYSRNCISCHPSWQALTNKLTNKLIIERITSVGGDRMPPSGAMSATDKTAMVNYLNSIP